MKSTEIVIREARVEDIPQVVRHRIGMYEAMEVGDPESREEMATASAKILPQAIRDGSFRGWLAEVDGKVVAGGGLFVTSWLSHPGDLICRKATVLNVYTDPEYRRQGIARKLMEVIVEWCRKEGFANLFLHASHEGRPLYEGLGFQTGNEMRLKL
ncbi:MAG TPA: GNAT family N-acetyltransferase [Terriglobales bacterium]|jgi:GNAT superfamily N-acetyltransferase|nr:GNAT family N-acetyltransferase [Terriglobales bacterium]